MDIIEGSQVYELATHLIFGDSTVLLPSAAALFIVLMLRKTSRLLAWQWSLLFGITGAIVCASKLAFMGWGLGIRELEKPITPASAATSALRGLLAYLPNWLLSARFRRADAKAAVVTGYVLAAVVGFHGWSSMRIPSRK